MSPWFALELTLDFGLPLLLAALGIYLLRRAIPPAKIKNAPVCRACAYNLTGITAPACPECAFSTHPTRRQRIKLISKKRASLGLLLCIPFLWVFWISITFYAWALPLQHNLTRVMQTRPSGAAAKVQWAPPIFEDNRTDSTWNRAGLWVTIYAFTYGPAYSPPPYSSPFFEAQRLTRRHNINLDPSANSNPAALRLSTFFIQWLFWPGEHYRRYVRLPEEPPASVTVSNASINDHDLFQQLSKIGPFTQLHVISSHIDGYSLESITNLTPLTTLDIQSIAAPMPELVRLKNLPNLQTLSIDFGRPISAQDIQVIDTLPNLATLTLTARQVQTGCDAALAQLLSKPTLWRVRLNANLAESDFPLTHKIIQVRFKDTNPSPPTTNPP